MGIVSVCKMTGAKSPLACFVCPVVAPAVPPRRVRFAARWKGWNMLNCCWDQGKGPPLVTPLVSFLFPLRDRVPSPANPTLLPLLGGDNAMF